ncbi:uncharacterized protein LOC134837850 [Culicoides brevitarsis]|uniref:uncharacterized protein LOC134837850 n=1 Tax=Culicoides brevitarsis TaxID=469753 RepID=UPI00307BE994
MFLCNFFHYFSVECSNNGTESTGNYNNVELRGDADDKKIIMKTISISTSTGSTSIGSEKHLVDVQSLSSSLMEPNENAAKIMQRIEGDRFSFEQRDDDDERSSSNGNNDKDEKGGSKQILSRKRRYLSFPSGSSFQVVYDQTIPIINLIDIFTIGVTVAIAWALPSEPLYKIHEQILDKYKQVETNRIDEIKQELLQEKMDKVANIKHEPKYPTNQTTTTSDNVNHLYLTPLNWNKNDWATVIQRIAAIKPLQQQQPQPTRRMRYYPVFGKRSVNERYVNHEDMFYAHHHRASRQTLYEKIEKFLEAKGLDGMQCVLRALCETGQRSNNHEPGTFLQEIMRAVFSLPGQVISESIMHEKHQSYDEAHSHEEDCQEKYSRCNHSIWDSNFLF